MELVDYLEANQNFQHGGSCDSHEMLINRLINMPSIIEVDNYSSVYREVKLATPEKNTGVADLIFLTEENGLYLVEAKTISGHKKNKSKLIAKRRNKL
jgi:hypothetical protein